MFMKLGSMIFVSTLFFGAVAERAFVESAPAIAPVVVEIASAPTTAKPASPEETATAPGPSLDTPRPKDWMRRVRRCRRRGRRRYCDGPRMVPQPVGVEAKRAEQLGLGVLKTASTLIVSGPEPEWLEAVDGEARDTLLWPVAEGARGRGFGYVRRRSLRRVRHNGMDIPAPRGSEVRSANDGLVVYADNEVRGYGNLMIILHADGSTTHYAHLRAAYLFAGQKVRRGQTIGEVGSTGLSGAPHVHFEWRVNGRPRNPRRHFEGMPSRASRRPWATAS